MYGSDILCEISKGTKISSVGRAPGEVYIGSGELGIQWAI